MPAAGGDNALSYLPAYTNKSRAVDLAAYTRHYYCKYCATFYTILLLLPILLPL